MAIGSSLCITPREKGLLLLAAPAAEANDDCGWYPPNSRVVLDPSLTDCFTVVTIPPIESLLILVPPSPPPLLNNRLFVLL